MSTENELSSFNNNQMDEHSAITLLDVPFQVAPYCVSGRRFDTIITFCMPGIRGGS